MIASINDHGKWVFQGVMSDSRFHGDGLFHEVPEMPDEDRQWAFHSNLGSITVMDRLTGSGWNVRDVETGYRDPSGAFWLATGGVDVRRSGSATVGEAIAWIKERANTCTGVGTI